MSTRQSVLDRYPSSGTVYPGLWPAYHHGHLEYYHKSRTNYHTTPNNHSIECFSLEEDTTKLPIFPRHLYMRCNSSQAANYCTQAFSATSTQFLGVGGDRGGCNCGQHASIACPHTAGYSKKDAEANKSVDIGNVGLARSAKSRTRLHRQIHCPYRSQ